MNDNSNKDYYNIIFKDYPDIVQVYQLKEMLSKIGKNKIYQLLKDKKIESRRIGRTYYIPKVNVIDYLTKK